MKILLALVFCLASIVCCAQEIIPRIGLTMTTANLPGAFEGYHTSFAPGFLTGVEAWFPIKGNFGIAGDFLFTQKGWRAEFKNDDYEFTGSNRVYYGELICLPYYKVSNFYFMVGPGLQYGLTGRANENVTDLSNGQKGSYQHDIHFDNRTTGSGNYYIDKRLTVSGLVSVGVTLWERLLIDLRYQASVLGTMSVTPNPSPGNVPNKDGIYHSLQFTTGLRLMK